ncbi:MAG: thermopsin, partial [Methanomassiliicoccales archaeon]
MRRRIACRKIQAGATSASHPSVGITIVVIVFTLMLAASPFASASAARGHIGSNAAYRGETLMPSHINSAHFSASQINPYLGYSKEPAPMGVADYGIGADGRPYEYHTNSFLGVINISSLSSYNSSLPSGLATSMTFQLNVVLTFSYTGTTYVYWIQNVVQLDTSFNYFSFIDNVWNLSSPGASIYNSTLSGNGSVSSSSGTGFYYDWASALPGNNVTLSYPAVVKLAVFSSTSPKGPEVTFKYNDGTGWQTYDNVYFIFAPKPTSDSGFVVDGYNYNPYGTYFDAELIMGGPGGGTSTNDTQSQLQLQLEYWNGNNYQLVPSAFNFGSDTAETIGNVDSYESYNPSNGALSTSILAGTDTLSQIYNQSEISFLNVTASFTFQGNISGTLFVNGTPYNFTGGDINLTLAPGTYTLKLYSGGILYWTDSSVKLEAGHTLKLNSGYSVTFYESSLPSGEQWSITLQNQTGVSSTLNSTTGSIIFVVPTGNYEYFVNVVNGYSPTMFQNEGNISQDTTVNVTFVKWPATMVSTGY